MNNSTFQPGFRISILDVFVLTIGAVAAFILGSQIPWSALVISIVIWHFFLFCNIFRISRRPELIWALCFIFLAGSTILTNTPSWILTIAVSIILSSFLIWKETRKPSYHGICWRRWNPNLPYWWKSQPSNKID